MSDDRLPYPFENVSVKEIMEIAKRIRFHDTNHGHSFFIVLNGEMIEDEDENPYIDLLAYMEFLAGQIDTENRIREKRKEPFNAHEFASNLINKINEFFEVKKDYLEDMFPTDILEYIGLDPETIFAYMQETYCILELFSKGRDDSLTDKATELLKVLDVPEEEVERRYKDTFTYNEINTVTMKEALDTSKVLKKTKQD